MVIATAALSLYTYVWNWLKKNQSKENNRVRRYLCGYGGFFVYHGYGKVFTKKRGKKKRLIYILHPSRIPVPCSNQAPSMRFELAGSVRH